jgi:hypothetical protein
MGTINETTGLTTSPVSTGDNSSASSTGTAVGEEADSTGANSVAYGRGATATGQDASAVGAESLAPAQWNSVFGYNAGGVNNGDNVTLIGRKAVGTGDNATAVGEMAEALAVNATAVGYNASAEADNSLALGAKTVASIANAVAIGDRDRQIDPGRGLVYEAGSTVEDLVDFEVDPSLAAGEDIRYDHTIDGQRVLSIRGEADGNGGAQNLSVYIPQDLFVDGQTTEVEDVITADVEVTDGNTVLLRADAEAADGRVEIDGDLVLTGEVKEGQTL